MARPTGELGGLLVSLPGRVVLARGPARLAEREQQLAAQIVVGSLGDDERLQAALVMGRGLLVAQASGCLASRGERVSDGLVGLAVGCGLREVIRERLDVRSRLDERLEGLSDLAMKAYPSGRAELLVERLAHERMREHVLTTSGFGEQSGGDGLIQRVEHARVLAQHTFEHREREG